LHPEVEATNNRSERQARSESMARKAARTSKTERGARRRGVIMSVLASLSKGCSRASAMVYAAFWVMLW